MAILTTSPEYTTMKNSMNTAIVNFIKNHPNSVKYTKTDNGKSLITLFFGEVRDVEIKKIAEICMDTLNDADFKIDGIPVTIIKSTESTIVFEGETAAVEEAIKTKGDKYPILLVTTSQTEDFDLDQLVSNIRDTIILSLVENRSDLYSYIFDPAGIKVDENSVTGRVIINIDSLDRYIERLDNEGIQAMILDPHSEVGPGDPIPGYMNVVKSILIAIRDVVLSIIRLKNKNKELLNGEFVNKLNEIKLGLERVNDNSVTITYSIEKYSEDKRVEESEDSNEYELTSDEQPVEGKTYYIFQGEAYIKAQDSDFDVEQNLEYEDVYEETADVVWNSKKTYYVEEAGGHREVTPEDLTANDDELTYSFKPDVTYYEKTQNEIAVTVKRFRRETQYYETIKH